MGKSTINHQTSNMAWAVPALAVLAAIILGTLIMGVAHGEVPSEVCAIAYDGNGSTKTFTFAFPILATSELRVVVRTIATGTEAVLVLNSGYSIADDDGDGDYTDGPGGSITTLAAAAYSSAYEIHLSRKPSLTQDTDLDAASYLRLSTLEDTVDKLTYEIQYLRRLLYRVPMIPETEAQFVDMNVPNSVARANSTYTWDANGEPLMVAGTIAPGDVNVTSYHKAILEEGNLPDSLSAAGYSTTLQELLQEPNAAGARDAIGAGKKAWIDITEAPYDCNGDGTFDNTTALQAALDAADADGDGAGDDLVVFIPHGTYLCGNLTLKTMTRVVGAHMWNAMLKCKTGTTGDWICDADGAGGIQIEGLRLWGNGQAVNALSLGNGTAVWTDGAVLADVSIWLCGGYGAAIKGTAARVRNVWVGDCDEGNWLINGSGNTLNEITTYRAGGANAVGVNDVGGANFYRSIHADGTATQPVVLNSSNNTINGVYCTVGASTTVAQIVKIASGNTGNQALDVRADTSASGAVVTNLLVDSELTMTYAYAAAKNGLRYMQSGPYMSSPFISNGTTAGTVRIYEASGSGSNYLNVTTDALVSNRTILLNASERRLAVNTAQNMQTNATATQYTVPAGTSAIITKVIVRNPSATLAAGTDYNFGDGANCDTWKPNVNLSTMTATTDCIIITNDDAKYTVYDAGDTFGYKADTGTAGVVSATISVYGIEF